MTYYKLNENSGKWEDVKAPDSMFPYTLQDAQENIYYSNKEVYKLALVGVGSSIAYYLNALGAPYVDPAQGSKRAKLSQNATPSKPGILFGKTDAWDVTERGDGFINHEVHEIGQWGKDVPEFSYDYMERAEFARQNRDVFERASGVKWVRELVTCVEKFGDIYKVCTDSSSYLAAKVVIGMGAGPHQKPSTMKVDDVWSHVLNLDQFMCAYPRDSKGLQDKHVIVNGANAGIDAVERAAALGATVTWFIGSTNPMLLDGQRLKYAPKLAAEAVRIKRDVHIKGKSDKQVQVTYTTEGENFPKTATVDLYVYALGQDPMAKGAVGDVLITKGNIKWDDLEPIYDINQIFGEPYETVIGLQRKKTTSDFGLQIIGAAVSSMAAVPGDGPRPTPRIKHNFAKQFERTVGKDETEQQLNARLKQKALISAAEAYLDKKTVLQSFNDAVRQDIGSVVLTAQLVGVKGTAAALTGFAPEYLDHDVNLSVDNRTMLRIYLANFIPGLSEEDAQPFINAVLQNRKNHSIGYTPDEVRKFKRDILARYYARLQELTTSEWGEIHRFEVAESTLFSPQLLEAAVELRRKGGMITSVRKRRGKQTVTISLTPTRYRR
ncbi:NAD(P)-binding domain-containing protein [Sorangium sp. So ce1000]|uniref:NAD(P)-binding domain-containing protein n=1 Tax=Sorangium sp. So ce1000 TaxID=3133325 RepID=UPI003F62F195